MGVIEWTRCNQCRLGDWLNWQSIRLQSEGLGVRFPRPLYWSSARDKSKSSRAFVFDRTPNLLLNRKPFNSQIESSRHSLQKKPACHFRRVGFLMGSKRRKYGILEKFPLIEYNGAPPLRIP